MRNRLIWYVLAPTRRNRYNWRTKTMSFPPPGTNVACPSPEFTCNSKDCSPDMIHLLLVSVEPSDRTVVILLHQQTPQPLACFVLCLLTTNLWRKSVTSATNRRTKAGLQIFCLQMVAIELMHHMFIPLQSHQRPLNTDETHSQSTRLPIWCLPESTLNSALNLHDELNSSVPT